MPSELEEIVQNVRMVLSTVKGTVPMDRSFGISAGCLDSPQGLARVKAQGEIVESIKRCEPRAKIKSVEYRGDGVNGELEIVVNLLF